LNIFGYLLRLGRSEAKRMENVRVGRGWDTSIVNFRWKGTSLTNHWWVTEN